MVMVAQAHAAPAVINKQESVKPTVTTSVKQETLQKPTERPVTQPEAKKEVEVLEPAQPGPAPQPQPHPVGCENYRHLISQYSWNVNTAINICQAESGGNPRAQGDNYPIRGLLAPSCGLFQVRTLAGRPTCEELKDPATNIAWAYRIYLGQGYQAWSVCKTKVNCY